MKAPVARVPEVVTLEPLHQVVALEAGHWRAVGDDPQLLLRWPDSVGPGPCRITVTVDPADEAGPSLYLDHGDGWSEASRLSLEPRADGRWTLLTWLQPGDRPARFDPVARSGDFRVDNVLLEPVGEAEAVLLALQRQLDASGDDRGAIVAEAYRIACTLGADALLGPAAGIAAAVPASQGPAYAQWIEKYDALSADQARQLRDAVAQLPLRPLVTLVLPVDGRDAGALQTCIESIVAQLYPDWELHLVQGEADLRPGVAEVAAAHVEKDARVRRTPPGDGVAAVVASARGHYLSILDQAPVLAPHALLASVHALSTRDGAVAAYSDSDRLEAGRRVDPYFKPEFNPELFLAQDFLGPLVLLSMDLVRDAGGVRDTLGGAPGADLLLRCLSRMAPARVCHVPLVLAHSQDVVAGRRREPVAERALAEHLLDAFPGAGIGARGGEWGREILWPLPEPLPKVSLVIPTRDRLPLLERCVESIRALTTYPDYEIIVVDNQSVEPATLAYLATLDGSPRIRVIPHDKPFNYSAICNSAVAAVDGAIVGLVNNDVEVISPDWLERMVQHAARPGVGAVGAMLYYPDDTIQHAGVVVGLGGVAGHAFAHAPRGAPGDHGRASLAHAVSAVTAACLLVRRDVYLEAGGLDESLQVAFNDIDFCLKLLDLGYRNVWTPFAELYHHESASRGAEDTPEKQRRFQREVEAMQARWHRRLPADPSYNPNLSLVVGQAFMRADPPRMTLASWCDQLRAQACPTRRQP